ncbi:MAG: hypothetical protein ILA02_07510 [Clostridia bacterium]|nr:hypothetical protein [Clostridia bacterium]
MKARFVSLEWQKGYCDLVQGVKHNEVPSNAIRGGNGSFICTWPASVILKIEREDGSFSERNIIWLIKKATGRKRMSEKLIKNVRQTLKEIDTFELDSRGYIVGLFEMLSTVT